MIAPSLFAPTEEQRAYLLGFVKEGEAVKEHGKTCMEGCHGITYRSTETGNMCVMWETECGRMGTSLTHGTRRIKDEMPIDN